jgi:hypothetical protein
MAGFRRKNQARIYSRAASKAILRVVSSCSTSNKSGMTTTNESEMMSTNNPARKWTHADGNERMNKYRGAGDSVVSG